MLVDNGNVVTCTSYPSCCSTQSHHGSILSNSSGNAFALRNFVAAGTLSYNVLDHASRDICRHALAEDGWHTTSDFHELRAFLTMDDQTILLQLAFLVKHRFISVTYVAKDRLLVMRVYIVPFDLPNVQGRLRLRDEDSVMKPGKKFLQSVLSSVALDQDLWNGGITTAGQYEPFLPLAQDDRSLAQLYSDLSLRNDEAKLIPSTINGLRSTLYSYQRASVAAMLQKEMNTKPIVDPLYIQLTGVRGDTLYYQPGNMEVLRERPSAAQSRGGLLCEELGTGKTVMILALILATLNVLPELPESIHEPLEVFTPLSYQYFPWTGRGIPQHNHTRSQQTHYRRPAKFPTLVELCLHKIRTNDCGITASHEEELEQRQLFLPLANNAPFYIVRDEPSMLSSEYSNRRQPKPKYKAMYLSTATLIVVPENLITQWSNEIMKHCSTPLRVLTVFAKTKLPGPNKLASDYDIVLTAYSRISIEASQRDTLKLYTGYNCACPKFRNVRVANCTCATPAGVSTLLQIHWKRIVRDEGHNSATNVTNINNFLNSLVAERRWIVTGTPTTNLLGLNFGKSVEDVSEPCELQYPHDTCSDNFGSRNTINKDDATYTWGARDREDLRKLGDMMARFLRIPRFANDGDAFRRLVIAPLMYGPAPGAVRVLEQVMQSMMIRHRIEEIEADIILPPLRETTVLLDLDPNALMSFNLLQAAVAVNAVDSERTDMDYLFHPRNQGPLLETIENISLTLFWRVDGEENDYDLPGALLRAKGARIHALERNQPDSDLKLVDEAIDHIQLAVENKLFRKLQHGLEVPYHVHHFPTRLLQPWANIVSSDCSTAFIYPFRAFKLRDAIMRQPKMTEFSLEEYAEAVREDEEARNVYLETREASTKTGRRSKSKFGENSDSGRKAKTAVNEVRRSVDSPAKLEEVRREFDRTQARLRALAGIGEEDGREAEGSNHGRHIASSKPTGLRLDSMRMSPVAPVRVRNSTSTKLNYILNEIRRYAATEKFLIFSRQPLVLAHIAEGLELLGIRFLQFTTEVAIEQRRQFVTTFETSDMYKVFLMELKHGARGLNIVSASRVIFCEPVWQADVESQAIKRVHRIGQTRPVTVKTLAIRGTFEEAMIGRRNALKGHCGKLPGMVDDGSIRSFLQNPRFLEPSPPSDLSLDISLLFPPGLEDSQGRASDSSNLNVGSSAAGTAMEVDILIPSQGREHSRAVVEGAKADQMINNSENSPNRAAKMSTGQKRPRVKFVD